MTNEATATPSWRTVVEKGYSDDCLWYAQYINQYLAMPPTYLFWRLGIRPNTVSAISLALTCLAIAWMVFLPPASWAGSIGVFLLLNFAYVLDSTDGQLARAAGWGSTMGYFLDHFLDGVKILMVNSAFGWILVSAYAAEGGSTLAFAYATFAVALFGQGVFFVAFNFKGFIYKPKMVATAMKREKGSSRHLLLLQPTEFGIFSLLALLCHRPDMLLVGYAAYGVYHAAVTLAYVAVSLRTMVALERANHGMHQ